MDVKLIDKQPRAPRRERRAAARQAAAGGPFLSLAMIVRNEAEGIARCLSSVANCVDEIIIVDTGSTDDTKAIAGRFTEHVYDDLWEDDFAAARQRSFDAVRGEWIMFLDGDDEVFGAEQLRGLCRQAPAEYGAICLPYITGRDSAGRVTQQLYRERVVRRGQYAWGDRTHAVLLPLVPNKQLRSDVCWVETHSKGGIGTSHLERNVRLLYRDLAEQPVAVPRTLYYLARDLSLLGKNDDALAYFAQYLRVATWSPEAYDAEIRVARLHLGAAVYSLARDFAWLALQRCPSWPDAHFLFAEIAYYQREWERVISWCTLGRLCPPAPDRLFINPLADTHAWRIFYTNALYRTGRLIQAREATLEALAIVPEDPMHQHNLLYFTAEVLQVAENQAAAVSALAAAAAGEIGEASPT